MSKKLQYLIGIVLFLSLMPTRGISQTSDDTKSDNVEHTHRTHVVKKAWNGAKRDVSTGANATVHATSKVWHGAKRDVSQGAKATGHATAKVWRGTKQVAGTAVRAPGKVIHKAKVRHEEHEEQKDESK